MCLCYFCALRRDDFALNDYHELFETKVNGKMRFDDQLFEVLGKSFPL